jgi:alkanesulfonate monooxygenase
MPEALRFHWRLLQGGDVSTGIAPERLSAAAALPELSGQIAFCREVEQYGIDSVLVDFSSGKPDPMVLGLALAAETERLKFMVAHRPGLMAPTLFVQQVNTFSTLAPGRITLNMVAGHSPGEQATYGDSLAHDERYARMQEFLSVCHLLWADDGPVDFAGRHYHIERGRVKTPFVSDGRRRPEIYLGGGSDNARNAASEAADCWLRFADGVETVAREAAPVLASGTEVGLRLACICRPTRDEAIAAARALIDSHEARSRRKSEALFVGRSDAESMRQVFDLAASEWLGPSLWTGAVQTLGATSIALIGTPDEVAAEILHFKNAGVSQFIFHGWPKWEEMRRFGRDVIPRVRALERQRTFAAPEFAER